MDFKLILVINKAINGIIVNRTLPSVRSTWKYAYSPLKLRNNYISIFDNINSK